MYKIKIAAQLLCGTVLVSATCVHVVFYCGLSVCRIVRDEEEAIQQAWKEYQV